MPEMTAKYRLLKPLETEAVDVSVINNNMDKIDTQMFLNEARIKELFNMIANEYDSSLTYNKGEYCIYSGKLFKCISAVVEPEGFDSTKWEETTILKEILLLISQESGTT